LRPIIGFVRTFSVSLSRATAQYLPDVQSVSAAHYTSPLCDYWPKRDYLLGGKGNFAADRTLADHLA
jgi:hypothetical protein